MLTTAATATAMPTPASQQRQLNALEREHADAVRAEESVTDTASRSVSSANSNLGEGANVYSNNHTAKKSSFATNPSATSSANSVGFGGEETEYETSAPTSMKEMRTLSTNSMPHIHQPHNPYGSAVLNRNESQQDPIAADHNSSPNTNPNAHPARSHHSRNTSSNHHNSNHNSNQEDEKNTSNSNLFIRGLPLTMEQDELDSLFSPYGNILSSAVMRNIHTGESLGTAFVRFATHEEAKAALNGLQQRSFEGDRHVMAIQWARKKEGAPVGEARRRIMKLFVRNIPQCVTVEALTELFAPYGKVALVTIHRDTAAAALSSTSAKQAHGGQHSNSSGGGASGNDERGEQDNAGSCGGDKDSMPHLAHQLPPGGNPLLMQEAKSTVRNIAFVNYEEEGAAEAAAAAIHNTKPFAECNGIPVMVKLAEDNHPRGGGAASKQQQQQHASVAANSNNNGKPNATVNAVIPTPMSQPSNGSLYDGLYGSNQSGSNLAGNSKDGSASTTAYPLPRSASRVMVRDPTAFSLNAFPNNLAVQQQQQLQQQSSFFSSANIFHQHNSNNMNDLGTSVAVVVGTATTASPNTSVILGRSAPVGMPRGRAFNAPPPQQQIYFPGNSNQGNLSAVGNSHNPIPIPAPHSQQQQQQQQQQPQLYPPFHPRVNGVFPPPASTAAAVQPPIGSFMGGNDGSFFHNSNNNYNTNNQQQHPSSPSVPVTPHIYNSNSPILTTFANYPNQHNNSSGKNNNNREGGHAAESNQSHKPREESPSSSPFHLPAPRSFQVNAESSFVLRHMQSQPAPTPTHPPRGSAHSSNNGNSAAHHTGSGQAQETMPSPYPHQQSRQENSFYAPTANPTAESPSVVAARRSSLSNPSLVLRANTAKIATAAEVRGHSAATKAGGGAAGPAKNSAAMYFNNPNQLSSLHRVASNNNNSSSHNINGGSGLGSKIPSGLSSSGGSTRVYRHNPYTPLTTVSVTTPTQEDAAS